MVLSGLLAIWGDGHRAEPVVECGLRRLAGVLGLAWGGRTATQLRTAIERLKTTTYRTTVSDDDGGREKRSIAPGDPRWLLRVVRVRETKKERKRYWSVHCCRS